MTDWDRRYLALAKFVASWSKDPSTQAGAVIVACDRSKISVGFNGFPRAMPDRPELYADRTQKYSRIIHAEINAQIFAGDVRSSTLYTWPFPTCDRCFVQMVQAGIARFVAPSPTAEQRERWGDAWARVDLYTYECNVPYVLLDNAA